MLMQLVEPAKSILSQLSEVIFQLDEVEYARTLDVFSGASVGQHTRHILEFYECLLDNIESSEISYDERSRSLSLEENPEVVLDTIKELNSKLDNLNADKQIILVGILGNVRNEVPSSISRELLYVVEHAVHHMAIIKIGLLVNFPKVKIAENFGVAESTVRYKQTQCAQ